jgi:acylphosphatase
VGFRFFVQGEAERLGLAGYARNLADGSSVEVMAEGRREGIESLLAALRRGPGMALVADVSFEWTSAEGRTGFEVR